jgi:Ribbon-helix-helix protein, copG family
VPFAQVAQYAQAVACQRFLVPFVQVVYKVLMDKEPKDVRVPVMVTRSELEAIDAWRYANRLPTRSEAIRRLIEMGLEKARDG